MTRWERHFVEVNGVRLHYVAAGEGKPVLLLHGFPETHRSWDLQRQFLVERGHRVVTPDLRGYGESDAPPGGYDLDTLARDVAGLIEHLGGRVSLVGHDWGGAVTWRVATLFPELVERVVVIACPHPVLMAKALVSNRRQIRRSWYMFFFQLPLLPERWLARDGGQNLERLFRTSPGSERAPRTIVDAERVTLASVRALRGPIAYYRTALRTGLGPALRGRIDPGERRIELPLTLVWGELDSCLGSELIDGSERYASRLDIQLVAGAGHFVHQERPDEVNRLLANALA